MRILCSKSVMAVKHLRSLLFLLTIFGISFSSTKLNGLSYNFVDGSRFSTRYYAGEFINLENFAEAEAFMPWFVFDRSIAFLDAAVYAFSNNRKYGASIGAGYRADSNIGILGINTFVDYCRIAPRVNLRQIGVGFELLSDCFDIRVNTYWPTGEKAGATRCCSFDLDDGYFASNQRLVRAYGGVDAELGLPIKAQYGFLIYAGAGPYYYRNSEQYNFVGGMARVEINWQSIISLQARASYDDVNSFKAQGILEINIPFEYFYSFRNNSLSNYCRSSPCDCNTCGDCCPYLYLQPIRRNEVIITDKCCNWEWNWTN